MRRGFWTFLAVGGVGATALLVRLVGMASVFPANGWVVFPGHDPYYHMRRILLTVQDWPSVPFADAAMNHPFGAPIIWPPLFDLVIATAARFIGLAAADTVPVETMAAFVPPLLGAMTVVPVFFLARRLFGPAEGMLAAALLALSPAHLWYSRLGFVDHHVAATLVQVLMLLAALRALETPRRGRIATLALVIACGLATWNGFLLYVALLDAGLVALLLLRRGDQRGAVADLVAWSHLLAAGLLAPLVAITVSRTGEPFGTYALSWFHVLALIAFALAGLAARTGTAVLFRALIWAAVGGLAVFLVVRADVARQGAGWILTADPFMSRVEESTPLVHLFREQGSAALQLSLPSSVTLLHLLFPLSWIVFLRGQFLDRFRSSGAIVFLAWSGGGFLLALAQRRFIEALAPALAILVAWLLLRARRFSPPLRVAIVAAVLIAAFVPWHFGWLADQNRADAEYDASLYRELERFRVETLGKEPRGLTPAHADSGPGAVNPWPLGHRILYLTGLPVVSNNFGSHIGAESYRDWAAFFVAGDESQAVELLRERGVQYVIVDQDFESFRAAIQALSLDEESFFDWRPGPDGRPRAEARAPFLLSMYHRLSGPCGAEMALPEVDGVPLDLPALDHFRLVQAPSQDGRGRLRIFERVEGARLLLSGEPGDLILLSYPLNDLFGREISYRKTVLLDELGVAETTVPYPSDRADRGWSSTYRLSGEGGQWEVHVSERDVRLGRMVVVDGPFL